MELNKKMRDDRYLVELDGYRQLQKTYSLLGIDAEYFGLAEGQIESEYFQYLHAPEKHKAYDLYRACIVSKHQLGFAWEFMAFFPPFRPENPHTAAAREPGDLRYLLSISGVPVGTAGLTYLNQALSTLAHAFATLDTPENREFLASLGFVNASHQL